MKFGDLSNNVGKDYVFDLDKFLSFEGKTGTVSAIHRLPHQLYFKQSSRRRRRNNRCKRRRKRNREKYLKLNSSYEVAYKEKSLNNLCLAHFDLASAFSTFYNNHKI